MGSPGPASATLPRNLNDPTNVYVLMIHEAHLRSFFPVMGGQAKRKRGKELVMAFQRRMGARVAIARGATFTIPAKWIPNFFETFSKQLRNST